MHLKYLHYFGNESSDSILEAYGIITKDKVKSDVLKSRQCPNCNEPNKPDSKFCARCRMILTYGAYSETLESEKEKQDRLESFESKLNTMQSMMEKLVLAVTKAADVEQQTELVNSMYESGWLKVSKDNPGTRRYS
jgi:hypothetical protein